jgi:hypothetical protein
MNTKHNFKTNDQTRFSCKYKLNNTIINSLIQTSYLSPMRSIGQVPSPSEVKTRGLKFRQGEGCQASQSHKSYISRLKFIMYFISLGVPLIYSNVLIKY